MTRIAAAFVMLVAFPVLSLTSSDGPDGKFRDGLRLFEEEFYEMATEKFNESRPGLKPIDDYVLLYLSKAQLELGNNETSLSHAQELLKLHADSPLAGDARALEIKNRLEDDWSVLKQPLAAYTKAFPGDGEMRLLYGKLLKQNGEDEESEAVLKALFIFAGKHAKKAGEELGEFELTNEEKMQRARNLMAQFRNAEAESLLRQVFRSDKKHMREATELLALSVFRQRRYAEAAPLFRESKDLYNAARSYIRAGNMDLFYKTLDRMITNKDDKGGPLLVALADEVRRDGNTKDALALLDEAQENFPLVREDILWGRGWTLYSSGDYTNASSIFDELNENYGSSKYRYWSARCREKLGKDAGTIYNSIDGSDYYFFLAGTRKGGIQNVPSNGKHTIAVTVMQRIDLLIQVGLSEEAAAELETLARDTVEPSDLLSIALKLTDIGEHRKAIQLLSRVPEETRPDEILYPRPFWPEISAVSEKYGIDPYLLLSLIREESRYDPEAVSPVGALGLMQLMPRTAHRTARDLKLPLNGSDSIHKVENNIALGSSYLNKLLTEFEQVPLALAAYNAGEHRVRRWLKKRDYEGMDEFIEDIPYRETRKYVKRIVTSYFRYHGSNGGFTDGVPHIL